MGGTSSRLNRSNRLIEEGDTIPADARLLHSTALQTAEAP
jgi:hypothetical protein